jgi:hypothetical protein
MVPTKMHFEKRRVSDNTAKIEDKQRLESFLIGGPIN